jgi:hypothetical protein
MTAESFPSHAGRHVASTLGVARCALTGGAVFATLFVLCWIGAVLNLSTFSHMYLALFVSGPIQGVTVLFGVVSSVLAGLFTGALVAVCYNVFVFAERR